MIELNKLKFIANRKSTPKLFFRIIRGYFRFVHDKMYYRHSYVIGKENVPPVGSSFIIASNHQNCLNDPLGVIFSFSRRKVNVFARADIFNKPRVAKFLVFLGLIPAYRMRTEGVEAVQNNKLSFGFACKRLLNGNPVLIFPESKNQDKRWLGEFSLAYVLLGFEAAEMTNFEKEIFILPACNHYSHYFRIQSDVLIRYGKPISLAPYYELYKTKPRTAQRQVNQLVRDQISRMMLNIEDLDNYQAIDFIRKSYGVLYAKKEGLNPDFLPEKLESDKNLVEELDHAKESTPNEMNEIYALALEVSKGLNRLKIYDRTIEYKTTPAKFTFFALGLIVQIPFYIFALVPNVLIFWIPQIFTRKLNDKMFVGSVYYGISALFTIPLCYGALFFTTWHYTGLWWVALIYLLLQPSLAAYAWQYHLWCKKFERIRRFQIHKNSPIMADLIKKRNLMFQKLDDLIKK